MPAKKVLMLTPQTPYPPDQGAAIRNYSFVRYLGSNPNYELSLLTFRRPHEKELPSILNDYCKFVQGIEFPGSRSKVIRLRDMLLSSKPDLTRRLASLAFEEALASMLEKFKPGIILCEGLEMTPFVSPLMANKLVLDEHNAEYLLQKRIYQTDWKTPAALYSLVQARRLARYEARLLSQFKTIAVSEADKQALQKLNPASSIAVIPNGIDLEEFKPTPNLTAQPDTLVFSGTMDFKPNVDAVCWFAREILPLIRQKRPQVRFVIVGRRPTPAVQNLARLGNIEVTGEVADARPLVQESQLYVVPMRMGGGVRFKVLEAMALGKPVVTTAMGADGIDLVPNQHAVVASDPQAFAQAVSSLLNDPNRQAALASAGRTFVEEYFDWRKIVPRLDEVLLG